MEGEEDCLFLNIYTPQNAITDDNAKNVKLPVMFWIHGGGFTFGASKILIQIHCKSSQTDYKQTENRQMFVLIANKR